jgi:CBS domain-containing protein
MRIAEVMKRDAAVVRLDDSVQMAAQRMAQSNSEAVFVGSVEQVDGILTARDILVRVTAKGLDPEMTPIREVMSPIVETCNEFDTAESVTERMAGHGLEKMPVIDPAGRLIGIVSRDDLENTRMDMRSGV